MPSARGRGHCLRIGDVIIGIQDLGGRCIVTKFNPDTLKLDRQVLADIVRKFDGTLTLNSYVIWGGEIRVGDAVELAPVTTNARLSMRSGPRRNRGLY